MDGSKLGAQFEKVPDFVRSHRRKLWAGLLFLSVGVIAGLSQLRLDMTLESMFQENDPAKRVYERLKETFGGDDNFYLVYRAKDDDVLSEKSLGALKRIHDVLFEITAEPEDGGESMLEHIVETKSLINVSYLEVGEDGLVSRDFVGEAIPGTESDREKLRDQALRHRDYPLFYLSEDSRFGGIFIRTDFGTIPEESETEEAPDDTDFDLEEIEAVDRGRVKYRKTQMGEYSSLVAALDRILEREEIAEHLEFHAVGNPVTMAFFNDVLNNEMSLFLPAAVFLMLSVLYFLFRSFCAVVWSLAIVVLTALLALGLSGWLGLAMNMMVTILIMLILVVGIADSIHILSGYLFFRKRRLDHRQALRSVLKKSGLACLLTSVTTSIGLLSLVFVDIPPIRHFGIAAALGVTIAFALTIFYLPLMLDVWQPIPARKRDRIEHGRLKSTWTERFLGRVEPLSFRFPRLIAVVFGVVVLIAAYGVSKVRVDSNIIEIVKEGTPLRIAAELVDSAMSGSQNLEIYLEFRQEDALKDPKVLNAMDNLQTYLQTEHPRFVVRTNSLVNVVKNSFQVLRQNDPKMYAIPQKPDLLSQVLLIFENANLEDRKLLATDDYRQARISVRLKNYGSLEYLDFMNSVEERIDRIFSPLKTAYPQMKVELTGGLALMMRMIDRISWSQIKSFGLALVVITVLLFLVLGSLRFGLVAMVPNVFPVLATFGVMGLFGISLDGDTLIVAPIVIGIAVDDTIHFITHYRLELAETGGDIAESIRLAVREAGQAITFSTIIIAMGFLVLVFSSHKAMANFGYLTALAFFCALLADLLLLPALCVLFNVGRE